MKILKAELEKLAPMSFTEKRQYIWEYYKLHIIVIVFVVFIAGSLLNTLVFNPPRQDYLYFVWIGPPVTTFVLDDFAEELNKIVENPDRYAVRSSHQNFEGLDPQMVMGLQARFVAQLQRRSLDIFMITKEELYYLSSNGLVLPIKSFMNSLEENNPSVHDFMAKRLIEITFFHVVYELTITDYMAVSLDGVSFFDKFDIETDNLYLAVVINTERFERAARALEVIFDV